LFAFICNIRGVRAKLESDAKERVEQLASDLLEHFKDRTATLAGKAMIVCMTRNNCVRLYDELTALPGCPEVKIIMTGDLGKDPEAWSTCSGSKSSPAALLTFTFGRLLAFGNFG
jgi:type I restriction enzyme R subunit